MPSGNAFDAIKNLIRHGNKDHHTSRSSDKKPGSSTSSSINPTSPTSAAPSNLSMEKDGARHKQEQAEQQAQAPVASNQPKESVTAVPPESQPKNSLPRYAGLENFQLMEKMGDGAFSNVYKAMDLTTRKLVAVKVVRKYELNATQAGDKHLNKDFKKKPRVTERTNILKEVQIMRGTQHPSVVKLISFSESREHYFIVLELMAGGELFHQIVKLTYFSENLARHVILQVAHGIRYLHEERGVVHRDIKPENLLFDRIPIIPSKHPIHRQYDEDKEDEGEFIPGVGGGGIGRVKIADFGLSKVVWDEQTMTPCGTVGYTAPEIVKDERYSKSVDMWALGCVLYTLLCGFPPFYDESINVLTEKVARGQYTFLAPWWDDISHSSKDLITHLLCVDPSQRYTIDEFLAHPWCHAAPAPPPPPTPAPVAMDSPLLSSVRGGRGEGGRSPGINVLKEAFDVTYAVHRMEEEGARRRAYNGRGGAGQRGFLHGLNEDDEDESSILPAESLSSTRSGGRTSGAERTTRSTQNRNHGFELKMDGATLLGRRHKKDGPSPSPLGAAQPVNQSQLPPGSPMHY